MKYCPICEKNYGDEAEVCTVEGATLRQSGVKQDSFVGKVIKGRYNVLRKIGEGGMGTVYLAEQVSIGRKIALKVLRGQYARDEEFVRRFRSEARLAASLNHRSVITIYDFDQADDGSLFIVMEHVEGRNLKEIIQGGPLDVGMAVRLGMQIAEGLGAAHRAGVIHRDIKPENIMVAADGDQAKLMDFGIARLRDTGDTRLTRADAIMGTPAYMAPEQIEGREVSERTDIYAFGIVLYEMLTGEVPFKGSTPSAVILKHLQEMPVPLRTQRQEIPPAIERVVTQALEKQSQKRQQNMEEVVQGLKKSEETLPEAETSKHAVEPESLATTKSKKLDALEGSRRSWPRLNRRVSLAITVALTALVVFGYLLRTEFSNDGVPIVVPEKIAPPKEPITSPAIIGIQEPPVEPQGNSRDVISDHIKIEKQRRRVAEQPQQQQLQQQQSSQRTLPKAAPSSGPDKSTQEAERGQKLEGSSASIRAPSSPTPIEIDRRKILDHMKIAKSYRERGEYSDALAELEKARSLDPTDREVQAETDVTRKACNAERQLGRPDLRC